MYGGFSENPTKDGSQYLSLHLRRASKSGTGVCRATMANESNTCS